MAGTVHPDIILNKNVSHNIYFLQIFNMLKLCLIIGLSVFLVAAVPTPQDEDDVEEDVCLTALDSKDPGKECVFPFKHENITYFGCPMDPEDATRRWCSTKTDENDIHVKGSFGYCTKGCKPEISAGTKYSHIS